jgi:hypothetical protein
MREQTKRYGGFGLAAVLVITGTLASGFLPSTMPYQVLAGGFIVAGFLISFVCLGGVEFPE